MKEGSIQQYAFKQEISFREVNGKIIVPVRIQGKFYDFLFDTGAITVVNQTIANDINLKSVARKTLADFSGNKKKLSYVKIDSLEIQNINFLSIGAVISDLSVLKREMCVDVAGIIGANIMNKAVWQIDYPNKKIILTNSSDSLSLPLDQNRINFLVDIQGTPRFNIKTEEGIIGEVILDTGNDGGISLPKKALKIIPNNHETMKGYGTVISAFGERLDTNLICLSNITLGSNISIKNVPLSFKNNLHSGAIGYSLLKNSIITIDWKRQNIYFSDDTTQTSFFTYGFQSRLLKNKLVVSYIYENTPAHTEGLQLNDQIIEINQKSYINLNHDGYCDLLNSDEMTTIIEKSIQIKIKRDNKEINCILKKVNLNQLIKKTTD